MRLLTRALPSRPSSVYHLVAAVAAAAALPPARPRFSGGDTPELPAHVDALDKVPEPYRPLYAAQEGGKGFAIRVANIDAHPGVAGLRAKRDELLGTVNSLKTEAKKYEGIDPEKYRELTAAAQKAQEDADKAAGNWDALKSQLVTKHGEEVKKHTDRISLLESFAHATAVENVARATLESAKGSVELLLPHVERQVKPKEEVVDGRLVFTAVVVDAKGNPRIKDASGAPMTIADLVAEMKADPKYAAAFEGTGIAGGGAPGSGNGGGAPPGGKRSEMTAAQKSAYIGKHGMTAFLALAE